MSDYIFVLPYGDGDNPPPPPPESKDTDELPPSAKGKTTFTQEEFNRALSEDRRKHKAQVEKTVRELEDFKKNDALSAKERETLQTRIDELQNSMMTKEQLAAKEKERLETTHKAAVQSLTSERDSWQNRFVKSTINSAIVSEAARAEAFDSDALIAMLGPISRLAQETDEDGKPLESFVPKVKFSDVDKDGKSVTLDLTVEQAIKRMKEMPKYGYLFKSTAGSGLGGSNAPGSDKKLDFKGMSYSEYLKNRDKIIK